MKTIWKFKVEPSEDFMLDMPKGAEILSVQTQFGEAQMWAVVDPEAPKEKRRFCVHGTGHKMCDDIVRFIGTFQPSGPMMNFARGTLIFHLFERKPK